MEIVIDSNIVAGYYKESVLGMAVGPDNDLTATVIPLFDGLGSTDTCYLDDRQVIETEWRGPVSNEWFDPWFAALLRDGKAQLIPVASCPALERNLFTMGFPRHLSRDIWYIRVCSAVLSMLRVPNVSLISEDIDFYDPRHKGCNQRTRRRILQTSAGPVRRLLRNHNILVRAVCNHH